MLRYAYCPDQETWARLRAEVLEESHLDIGDYPAKAGTVSSWVGRGDVSRHLVTLSGWAKTEEPEPMVVGTIAHEAWHVVAAVLEAMSEEEPGEETCAYMLGTVVQNLWAEYRSAHGQKQET